MELTLYTSLFLAFFVIAAALTVQAIRADEDLNKVKTSSEVRQFQRSFLVVYVIAMSSDWFQGPYIYALYSAYGYSHYDIAILYITGIASSVILGTFAGAAADKFGRKKACLAYCFLYLAMAFTKHSGNFWMLFLGRVIGGAATSLLLTCFESWMVCEHNARGYEQAALSQTFSMMYYGSSFVAILVGVASEFISEVAPLTQIGDSMWYYGGYVAPFDLACVILLVGIFLIMIWWPENYGESDTATPVSDATSPEPGSTSAVPEWKDPKVWLIGIVISLFEGSMYIFVYEWTPAITTVDRPYGIIFATFMLAAMGGSSLYSISQHSVRAETVLKLCFLVATISLGAPGVTTNPIAVVLGLIMYEGCVGVYWPAISTVKSRAVKEKNRALIYNLFRIPLNFVVFIVLVFDIPVATGFLACSILMFCCTVAQLWLAYLLTDKEVDNGGKQPELL